MVRNSFADLPIRWVSITIWPTAESSADAASRWTFSDDTVSAISSRSADWRLIVRSDWPTCVSTFCCASTVFAFFSARSTSGSTGSSTLCTLSGAAAMLPSPVFSPRTLRASTSALSRISGKAWALPISACETDLARRCDCISAWPLAATCAAPRPAEAIEKIVSAIRPSSPSPTSTTRMRC